MWEGVWKPGPGRREQDDVYLLALPFLTHHSDPVSALPV